MRINNLKLLPALNITYQTRADFNRNKYTNIQTQAGDSVSFSGNGLRKLTKFLQESRLTEAEKLIRLQKHEEWINSLLAQIPEKIVKNINLAHDGIISAKTAENALKIAYNIRNKPVEHIFYLDKKGEIDTYGVGSKYTVRTLIPDNSIINIHNHPTNQGNNPFSLDDIRTSLITKDRKSLVSCNNGLYVMTYPVDAANESSMNIFAELGDKYEKIFDAVSSKFENKIISENIANKILGNYLHQLWSNNAKKLGYEYKYYSWDAALKK